MSGQSEMKALLKRLQKNGIPITNDISEAMLAIEVDYFTDFESLDFFADRPITFLKNENGAVKTISAPHMIATLLFHLELQKGNDVVLIGCKSGYIAALIAIIVGEEGSVKVLDPSLIVTQHAASRLTHWPTIEVRHVESLQISPIAFPGELNRVLVTGQIKELPEWINSRISESGFIIAPLGGITGQKLMKLECQDGELLPTDLGHVSFGPVDITDAGMGPICPNELADILELAIETFQEIEVITKEEVISIEDLIIDLRELPDDLPPPGEAGVAIEEHPMIRLLYQASPSFIRLWPLLQLMVQPNLASPGGFDVNIDDDFEFDDFGI
ncbi:MAG: protein-L-isoaspartate O-methyltransferase [Candidatus Poseidoniaceae archaeon]|nr:protein-L-isoaspartate O-methyltransferase [Candidatus Poseidoniaceae archaeon]